MPKPDGNAYAALTDFLNLSFPFTPSDESIRRFIAQLNSCVGGALGGMTDRKRGLHGYTRSFAMDEGGALFAFGGQAGTGFLSLPGDACALVPDWRKATEFFRDALRARITRWDGAVDDFKGVRTVDDAVAWYLAGGFNAGGNNPSCSQAGDWIGSGDRGRTFYVGRRTNGKFFRAYEKGKQLGDPRSPWVRFEVEMHNEDRVIPFEVLLEPGKYVAGAFPCMGWVQEEASRIRTIQKTGEIGYEHLADCLSTAYGRLINVMMDVEGSAEKVVDKLRLAGVPKRLRLPIVPDTDGWPK